MLVIYFTIHAISLPNSDPRPKNNHKNCVVIGRYIDNDTLALTAMLIIFTDYKLQFFGSFKAFSCYKNSLNSGLLDSDPKTYPCHRDIDPSTIFAIIIFIHVKNFIPCKDDDT